MILDYFCEHTGYTAHIEVVSYALCKYLRLTLNKYYHNVIVIDMTGVSEVGIRSALECLISNRVACSSFHH